MQSNEMPRLSALPNLGAWLLTLLSFTHALASRRDPPFRTMWRDIVTNLNVPTLDSLDKCCPLNDIARIRHIRDHSLQNKTRHLIVKTFSDRSLNHNLSFKRKNALFKSRSFYRDVKYSRLRDIVQRITVKRREHKSGSYKLRNSTLSSLLQMKNRNSSSLRPWLPHKRGWGKSFTRSIFVHGKDDRRRIVPVLLRKFPYSDMVRLSTGCTGTLITPFHVLTAAHCVHNGQEFRNKLEMLKVEIPDTMGVRVYYIEKIGIPEKWLNPQSRNDLQAFYDFAVVRLSYGVHGRSKFLPLAVPSQEVLHERLQFLGFPRDSLGLWRSVCSAKSNKALRDGNLILTRCDSAVGNSGAAVLATDSRSGHKIIGILSSTMPIGRTPFYARYNIVTALTWPKLHFICSEIGQIGVLYGVCPSSEMIPKSRRFHNKNKVIPFFG